MRKRKKWYLLLLALFFAAMGICTYIADQIEEHKKPAVTVTEPRAGRLTSTLYFDAQVSYDSVTEVLLYKGCVLQEVFVEDNQHVKKGESLFQVDVEKTKLWLLQQKVQLKKLEEAMVVAVGEEAALVAHQITLLKKETQNVQQVLEQQGRIVSPADGIVRINSPVEKGMVLTENRTGCEICKIGEGATVTFVTEVNFQGDEDVLLQASVYQDEFFQKEQQETFHLNLSEKKYDRQNQLYVYAAKIPEGVFLAEPDGKVLSTSVVYRSEEYTCILPRSSAILTDEKAKEGYLFLLEEKDGYFRKEWIAKKVSVTFFEYNEDEIAVNGTFFAPVISGNVEKLEEEAPVRVLQ